MGFKSLVALVAVGCAMAMTPGLQASPATSRWEVAGVQLNMTAEQAKAALRARGYTISEERPDWSFQERIQMALGKKVDGYGSAVGSFVATKGMEKVNLKFVSAAEGALVSEVWYRVPQGQVSLTEAVSSMAKRIGPPAAKHTSQYSAIWCTDAANPRYCDHNLPSIKVTSDDTTSIMMNAGFGVIRRAEKAVAAASQGAPNRTKPTF